MTIRSLILLPMLFVPTVANAQIADIPPYFDPVIAGQGILLGNMVEQAGRDAGKPSGTQQSAPVADIDATYESAPAVRTRLAEIMAQESENRQAGTGSQMRELVQSGRAMSEYQRVAAMLGYNPNDAADALAFYLLALWGVANDHRAEVTQQQAAGVARQAHSAFAVIADQLDTDAKRQEFGEMLAIQGVIVAGTHEAAVRSGDDAALHLYADLARQGATRLLNSDPTDIVLTDSGFSLK